MTRAEGSWSGGRDQRGGRVPTVEGLLDFYSLSAMGSLLEVLHSCLMV